MTEKKIKPLRLVLVEWLDSVQPCGEWELLRNFEIDDLCDCASVGWLVHKDDHVIALAPNLADRDQHRQGTASAIIRIPAVAVTRIVTLKYKKK